MTHSERNAIADIIRINKFIYGLQDKIDEETERIIDDIGLPTKTAIAQLKAIETRRVDLCNLKVLYGIIERELSEEFAVLKTCAELHADSALYSRAEKSIKTVGYDAKRVIEEFKYLFDALDKPKRVRRTVLRNNTDYSRFCVEASGVV